MRVRATAVTAEAGRSSEGQKHQRCDVRSRQRRSRAECGIRSSPPAPTRAPRACELHGGEAEHLRADAVEDAVAACAHGGGGGRGGSWEGCGRDRAQQGETRTRARALRPASVLDTVVTSHRPGGATAHPPAAWRRAPARRPGTASAPRGLPAKPPARRLCGIERHRAALRYSGGRGKAPGKGTVAGQKPPPGTKRGAPACAGHAPRLALVGDEDGVGVNNHLEVRAGLGLAGPARGYARGWVCASAKKKKRRRTAREMQRAMQRKANKAQLQQEQRAPRPARASTGGARPPLSPRRPRGGQSRRGPPGRTGWTDTGGTDTGQRNSETRESARQGGAALRRCGTVAVPLRLCVCLCRGGVCACRMTVTELGDAPNSRRSMCSWTWREEGRRSGRTKARSAPDIRPHRARHPQQPGAAAGRGDAMRGGVIILCAFFSVCAPESPGSPKGAPPPRPRPGRI